MGPTSMFLVMVPGLFCFLWEPSPVSIEPWPEQYHPGHELLSTLSSHVFPHEVSKISGKEGNSSFLVFLVLHSVLRLASDRLWSTRGSSNFTEATALKFTRVFSSECIKTSIL